MAKLPFLTIFLVLLLTKWLLRSWLRLRHIPGPALAHFSGTWLFGKLWSGRFTDEVVQVAEQYGPLVRIGPNVLLCTDPSQLQRMSNVTQSYQKGDFYRTARIVPGCDNVVSERDEARHRSLRASLQKAYAGTEGIEKIIDQQLNSLVDLIKTKYISSSDCLRPLEFSTKAQYFALDVISSISFGSPFGFLTQDKDLFGFVDIADAATRVISLLQAFPALTDTLYRWPLRLVLPKTGDKVGFGRLMKYEAPFNSVNPADNSTA